MMLCQFMATIKDIAARAGVSVSTASRALNDNPRISEATREKIKKIAVEIGYHPNYAARNLTRGEANMVGLVFPVTTDEAPANPFHIDLMRGIASALESRDYSMVVALAPTQEKLLRAVKSMALQSKIHNFLLFYTLEHDPVAAYLREHGYNFVVIGHPERHQNDRYVDNDNVAAGYAATKQLLINHDVTNLTYVSSPYHWQYEEDRRLGYENCLAERHLPELDWYYDTQSASEFFSQHPKVDGLVCADDLLFLKLNHELQEMHLLDRLSVICFNNSKLLGMLLPTVEKVDLQPHELGKKAVELLFNPNLQHAFVAFKVD